MDLTPCSPNICRTQEKKPVPMERKERLRKPHTTAPPTTNSGVGVTTVPLRPSPSRHHLGGVGSEPRSRQGRVQAGPNWSRGDRTGRARSRLPAQLHAASQTGRVRAVAPLGGRTGPHRGEAGAPGRFRPAPYLHLRTLPAHSPFLGFPCLPESCLRLSRLVQISARQRLWQSHQEPLRAAAEGRFPALPEGEQTSTPVRAVAPPICPRGASDWTVYKAAPPRA